MKTLITVITAAVLVFIAAPAQAKASDYTTKQKNQYWKIVSTLEPDVKIIGKKDTIALGISTCELLRAGGTLEDLIKILLETEDSYLVEDMFMAATAAAPVALCRDQQYKFE